MKSIRQLAATLFAAVAVIAVASPLVAAQSSAGDPYGLHPVCGTISRSQITSTAQVISTSNTTELEVSCFSYNLIPVTRGGCTPTGGRVVLEFTDASGQGESIDLGRLYNGSLYASAFRFDTWRILRIYVLYPDYLTCPAYLYVTMYAEVSVRRRSAVEHPFVTSGNPVVMYRNAPYTLSFRAPVPLVTAAQRAATRLVMLHGAQSCSREAPAAYSAATPAAPVFINNTDFTWTTTASSNGAYVVCILADGEASWAVVAFVEAYGGNPAFFDSTTVRQTRQDTTLRFDFYGANLVASADAVAIVVAQPGSYTCGTNPTNAAAVSTRALTQRTGNTTSVEAVFLTTRTNSIYLICYRQGRTGEWVDVPNFDTMSRHVIQNVSDPTQISINGGTPPAVTAAPGSNSGSSPAVTQGPNAPATPSWLTNCPSAPVDASNARVTDGELVRITLGGTTALPGDFAHSVATLLCLLGPANVSIASVRASSSISTGLDVYVGVTCPETMCNSPERMAALARWATTAIPNALAAQVVDFNGVIVNNAASDSDNDHDKDERTSMILYVVVGVLVATVVALIVVVILVARTRRAARRRESMAHPDADVVQGHVIEVQGAPVRGSGARTGRDVDDDDGSSPYGNGRGIYITTVADHDDLNAPIPPPPQKPHQEERTATSAAADEPDDASVDVDAREEETAL